MAEEQTEATEQKPVQDSGTATADLSVFFGVKSGMTKVYDDKGKHVPVTVIKLIPNYISQVKTTDTDGYNAYQVLP